MAEFEEDVEEAVRRRFTSNAVLATGSDVADGQFASVTDSSSVALRDVVADIKEDIKEAVGRSDTIFSTGSDVGHGQLAMVV